MNKYRYILKHLREFKPLDLQLLFRYFPSLRMTACLHFLQLSGCQFRFDQVHLVIVAVVSDGRCPPRRNTNLLDLLSRDAPTSTAALRRHC